MKRDFRYVGCTEAYMKRRNHTKEKNDRDGKVFTIILVVGLIVSLLTMLG